MKFQIKRKRGKGKGKISHFENIALNAFALSFTLPSAGSLLSIPKASPSRKRVAAGEEPFVGF